MEGAEQSAESKDCNVQTELIEWGQQTENREIANRAGRVWIWLEYQGESRESM